MHMYLGSRYEILSSNTKNVYLSYVEEVRRTA